MDPEGWVKLLFVYGPFALLLLLIFLVEGKAREALKEAGESRKLFVAIYTAVWVFVFGLIIFSGYVWTTRNLTREASIVGTFEKLRGSEIITSVDRGAELYVRRVYGPRGRFDYAWRLVSRFPLVDGTRVRFTFDPGLPGSDAARDYELHVRSAFYEREVRIFYNRKQDKLFLIFAGQQQELSPIETSQRESQVSRPHEISPAWAGEAFAPRDIAARLESDDPIIRRKARTELAEYGKLAIPWIQDVLINPRSSYRLLLGVTVALNEMRDPAAGRLAVQATSSIILLSGHADSVLRREARKYILKYRTSDLTPVYEAILTDLKQAPKSVAALTKLSQLARTGLELYYNLGIDEKDRYGSRQPQDRPRIEKAFAHMRRAWDLRTLSTLDDRIFFPKALYGWGLALHDKSWIERRPDGSRDPLLVKAAQDKFAEFLRAVEAAGNKGYLYPDHLRRARAYLNNPVPDSLQ